MGHFSNGSDPAGIRFLDDFCGNCRYGQKPCPIACAQLNFNYDVVKNKLAKEILDSFVRDSGACTMFKTFEKDFRLTEGEKAQQELFPEFDCDPFDLSDRLKERTS